MKHLIIGCLFFLQAVPVFAVSKKEAANGFSTQHDVRAAVKEAADMVRQELGKKKPDFVMYGFTLGYDPAALAREMKREFGEKTKIIGESSREAVFDRLGYHDEKEKGTALSILAVSSKKKSFGVGVGNMDEQSPFDAGSRAITMAMQNAGKSSKPQAVIIFVSPGHEEDVIAGITKIVGNDTPIIGGSAADNTLEGKSVTIINDKVLPRAVVVACIYSRNAVASSFYSGYGATDRIGIVTKAKDRCIYEIDHKPAAEVYNSWCNGKYTDVLVTGGSILERSNFEPIMKFCPGDMDMQFSVSLHPLSINKEDRSLSLFARVAEGDRIMLGKGSAKQIVGRCTDVPQFAMLRSSGKMEDASFGLFIFCAGSMMALSQEERRDIPKLVNKEIQNMPYLGLFTYGEQGCVLGVGNLHQNLGTSMLIVFND